MVIIGGRTRRSRANLGVTTAGRQEGRAEVALSVASAGAPASVGPVGGPEGIPPPRRSANPGPRPHTIVGIVTWPTMRLPLLAIAAFVAATTLATARSCEYPVGERTRG